MADNTTPSVAGLPNEKHSWTYFLHPMIATKHIPLGTRLFLASIMLVILAITTYLFFYRTDNVAVSYAHNYDTDLFYQDPTT